MTTPATTPATTPIRWGILGAGGIAAAFATDLTATGQSLVAVGSRSQEKADAFAAEHGIPTAHGSYESLVADPGVDAIYVATPHPMHLGDAELALNAGKHVLVEKPFTLNRAEAERIAALAESKGLVVLEAMWTRFLPHIVRLREIIEAGTIGEVRTVIADHNQSLPTNPEHRLQDPALGGGALLDLGIYPVSFAWDILGEPSSVAAISSPTATGVDRQTAILLGYPGGQQAVLHTALDTAGPNTASVIGTKGWIHLAKTFYAPTTFTVFDSEGNAVETYESEVASRGMEYEAWELERRVNGGEVTTLPLSESVAIMGTLDEVRRQIGLSYPGEK